MVAVNYKYQTRAGVLGRVGGDEVTLVGDADAPEGGVRVPLGQLVMYWVPLQRLRRGHQMEYPVPEPPRPLPKNARSTAVSGIGIILVSLTVLFYTHPILLSDGHSKHQ